MRSVPRLLFAISLALAVSSLTILIELIVANSNYDITAPGYWDGALGSTLVIAGYVAVLGLVPGLLLHTLFVHLRWRALWQYLSAALSLGAAWCAIFHFVGSFVAAVIAAAILGTAVFWMLRRPDKIALRRTI